MEYTNRSMEFLSSIIGLSLAELERHAGDLLGNLGIDSLAMTRIRGALVPIPSYQVLYGLTISQVSYRLSQMEKDGLSSPERDIQFKNKDTVFALTPMQESYVIGANQGCPCQVYTELKESLLAVFQVLKNYTENLPQNTHFKERMLAAKSQFPLVFFNEDAEQSQQQLSEGKIIPFMQKLFK